MTSLGQYSKLLEILTLGLKSKAFYYVRNTWYVKGGQSEPVYFVILMYACLEEGLEFGA